MSRQRRGFFNIFHLIQTLPIIFIIQKTTFISILVAEKTNSNQEASLVEITKQLNASHYNNNGRDFSPRSLSNLLIEQVFKEEEEEGRRKVVVREEQNNTTSTALRDGLSSLPFSASSSILTGTKIFNVQVSAIHVDKAEFPLTKLLFKLTLKLALSAAEKRLQSSRIKLSLNFRSANTCSSQYAAAVAAEEYYTKRARLFIVSGCDDAIRGVSRLASGWAVPVMTAGGFGADLNDKSVYSTLVRVAFSLRNAVRFLIKILKLFSWHKVNLIVDESDPNSFALKDSIEKHLLESSEYQINLNTITLDLQSLITTGSIKDNSTRSFSNVTIEKSNSLQQRHSSTLLNGFLFNSEDKWPNDVTEQAVRDSLEQSGLYSRVNILLIPQNYLRRFMLSVYDQKMANGLYTFINMPLLLITSSSSSSSSQSSSSSSSSSTTETTLKASSFSEQMAPMNPLAAYNSSAKKQLIAPTTANNNFKQQQQAPAQSFSAQTGENVFLWRSLKSTRNSHAKQAFESLMSIYLKTPTTKAYVYFTGKLLNLANTNNATTTTTTTTRPSLQTQKTDNNLTDNFASGHNKSSVSSVAARIQLDVNPYVASFYDCLQIYASVLNESFSLMEKKSTQQQQTLDSIKNNSFSSLIQDDNSIHLLHSSIGNLVRRRRFENMVTGSIIINENGDRETDYTLDDMNPMTGKFSPVIIYKGESKEIERLARIHWSSDDSVGPTIDNIDCRLNGTCASKPWSKFLITLMLISAPLAVFVSLILYFVYRQINLESQLVDYWWKISLKDIELIETRRKKAGDGSGVAVGQGAFGSQVGSMFSKVQKGAEDDITDISDKTSKDAAATASGEGGGGEVGKNQSGFGKTSIAKGTVTNSGFASTATDVCYGDTHLGIYKLTKVALKPIEKFNQSRKLMIELRTIKTISHNNLCRFAGILVEEPNLALVSEFCPKGSLREFFDNESMVIDWTFKYSIINDIMAGLLYLHSSPIEYHGRLKSSNCLVSSRFVVKLSDYGLRSLYEQIDDDYDELDLMKKRIWCAPEHLKSNNLIKSGSVKGDVYSFGLLLYEIITNTSPFFDKERNDFIMPLKSLFYELKVRGPTEEKTGPNLNSIIDMESNKDIDALIDLMKRSWIYDPNKRLSMQEANATIKRITKGVTSKRLLENLTSRMEQYTNNLESLVEAKLATLVDEKSKTEELLYQFVPKSIALLLKEGQSVEPEAFDCVTVFYSDIVGFTSLSSESSPIEVIDFLSDLYLCFDETLEQYDIFKVDTIGDAYIVASGLPRRNEGKHVIEIARAALELRERISSFKIPHKPGRSLQMRVGINSGPCIAGIVGGVDMPKYCVFGDTLTTGKFMEFSGLPMKIHITEESKTLLDLIGGFKIEPRTPRITKDGLPFQSYWLENELR